MSTSVAKIVHKLGSQVHNFSHICSKLIHSKTRGIIPSFELDKTDPHPYWEILNFERKHYKSYIWNTNHDFIVQFLRFFIVAEESFPPALGPPLSWNFSAVQAIYSRDWSIGLTLFNIKWC